MNFENLDIINAFQKDKRKYFCFFDVFPQNNAEYVHKTGITDLLTRKYIKYCLKCT